MDHAIAIIESDLAIMSRSYVEGGMSTELRIQMEYARYILKTLKKVKDAQDRAANEYMQGE